MSDVYEAKRIGKQVIKINRNEKRKICDKNTVKKLYTI